MQGEVEGEVKVNKGSELWCGGRRFRLSGWPFSIRTPLGLHCSIIILRVRRLGQAIRWTFRTDLATPGRFSRFRCWRRRASTGRLRSELGIPRLTSDSLQYIPDHLLYDACRRKTPVPAPRDASDQPEWDGRRSHPRLPRHLEMSPPHHANFQLHDRIFNPQIFGSYVQLIASLHIPTDYDSATNEGQSRYLWRLSW